MSSIKIRLYCSFRDKQFFKSPLNKSKVLNQLIQLIPDLKHQVVMILISNRISYLNLMFHRDFGYMSISK